MSLEYHGQELYLDEVPLNQVATEYGSPCYVYSKTTITQNWHALAEPLQQSGRHFKIYYAVKANSNLAILHLLTKLGAGFDCVSIGEIERVLAAGGAAQQIVFAGVGKSEHEIATALDHKIYSLHVESVAELHRIQQIAQQKNVQAPIALRINPDVDAHTHAYISTGNKSNKFGIDYTQAVETYRMAADMPNITIKGITCHIGSQITNLDPFVQAMRQLLRIISELGKHNINLEYIDVGGGLGIRYKDETPPSALEYVNAILNELRTTKLSVHFEPGRFIVANAGILLTKVEYLKSTGDNYFAIVDAAMNDLMRPALYESYHAIVPVINRPDVAALKYSIVGPVCESGDFLGKDRMLSIKQGDLLVVRDCGAYGFSMSSNYNSRPRAAEVLIEQTKARLIRARETNVDLWRNEAKS